MARRQTVHRLLRRRTLCVEAVFFIAGFDKGPQVAVVVAVADHGVFKKHACQLVALAAGAGGMLQGQRLHGLGAGIAAIQQVVESVHAVNQVCIPVSMAGVEQGKGQHCQAVAQATDLGGVASAFYRARVQRQQERAQAGVVVQQQVVDAGVFQAFGGQALQGAQVVGHQRATPAPVRGHVGQRHAVAVQAVDVIQGVVHIGQADTVVGGVLRAPRRWCGRIGQSGGVGVQGGLVLPQGAQRQV